MNKLLSSNIFILFVTWILLEFNCTMMRRWHICQQTTLSSTDFSWRIFQICRFPRTMSREKYVCSHHDSCARDRLSAVLCYCRSTDMDDIIGTRVVHMIRNNGQMNRSQEKRQYFCRPTTFVRLRTIWKLKCLPMCSRVTIFIWIPYCFRNDSRCNVEPTPTKFNKLKMTCS